MPKEISQDQATKLAMRLHITLTEQDEIAIATDFAQGQAKSIACHLLGIGTSMTTLKKMMREHRNRVIEWRKLDRWKRITGAYFDTMRGCYMVPLQGIEIYNEELRNDRAQFGRVLITQTA